MIFKIYGERNSGTTFLTDLLKKNKDETIEKEINDLTFVIKLE